MWRGPPVPFGRHSSQVLLRWKKGWQHAFPSTLAESHISVRKRGRWFSRLSLRRRGWRETRACRPFCSSQERSRHPAALWERDRVKDQACPDETQQDCASTARSRIGVALRCRAVKIAAGRGVANARILIETCELASPPGDRKPPAPITDVADPTTTRTAPPPVGNAPRAGCPYRPRADARRSLASAQRPSPGRPGWRRTGRGPPAGHGCRRNATRPG